MNYIHRKDPPENPYYALYRYVRNSVPGLEDDTATDVYDAAISGEDAEASDNLNALLAELTSNYQINSTDEFPGQLP